MITLAWQGFDLEIQQTNCTSYGKNELGFISFDNKNVLIIIIIIRKAATRVC